MPSAEGENDFTNLLTCEKCGTGNAHLEVLILCKECKATIRKPDKDEK